MKRSASKPHLASVLAATLLAILTCQQVGAEDSGACRPLGKSKAALLELKANDFRIPDEQRRESFAFSLLDCLGDPDPELRDGVAYEAYVSLLRGKELTPETIIGLRDALVSLLDDAEDENGFKKPFAALVLAEVARTDRIDPLFSAAQRAEVVHAATSYMLGIDDYRGFDEQEGWRHGVAHGADLMLQLVLNPALTRSQLGEIRDAIAVQVAPAAGHFYIYGEPGRLARPILYMAGHDEFKDEDWTGWFKALSDPSPFESWGGVWSRQKGLAKLHNTRAFAQSVYVSATVSERVELKPLAANSLTLLRALP